MKKPALQYAIHYLSRFPKTKSEMKLKLFEKGYDESEIDETIAELEKYNYINDRAFADAYVQSDLVRKGKPIYAIKAKLLQKGLDEDVIQRAFDEYSNDITTGMKAAILKEIDKRKADGEDPIDIIQRLQRKWYHFQMIKRAIEERARERDQEGG